MAKREKDESQVFIENIVAEIPVSVYWMNRKFIYLGCSDSMAELLKLSSRHEIVGKSYSDLFDEKSAEYYRKADSEVMSKDISLSLEEPLYFPDGTKKIYLSKKIPLHDSDGHTIGMLGISVDITDRKKMEEELRVAKEIAEAASHAKSEFIANMSHDIRTPLTGIIGLSQILEEEVHDAEEKQHAHWVHESGEQLLDLLNGVLDLVSIGSTNENDIKYETFDLHRVINDVLDLERAAVKVRKLDIKTHIEGGVPHYVVSDRMKMHRILLNLVGNAIKFTKEGYIDIGVRLLSSTTKEVILEFHVEDTGIGIPKELLDKVFDRFFKVNPSYKGLYKGSGIGLHIAERYVQLLGGTLFVSSEERVGTTFRFSLPMKVGKEADCQSLKKNATKMVSKAPNEPDLALNQVIANPEEGLHILLVEDNMIALIALKRVVETLPAQVIEADSAESALPLVQTQALDLIITDIGLPGASGIELTKKIREWEKENQRKVVPIVGLTGHASPEMIQDSLDAGMNQVYIKPMEEDTLKKLVENYVDMTKK